MGQDENSRRDFLKSAVFVVGSAFAVSSCAGARQSGANNQNSSGTQAGKVEDEQKNGPKEKEVTAAEDLMREHGILRRALIVYSEAAVRLRKNLSDFPPEALQKQRNCSAPSARIITKSSLKRRLFFRQLNKRAAKLPVTRIS